MAAFSRRLMARSDYMRKHLNIFFTIFLWCFCDLTFAMEEKFLAYSDLHFNPFYSCENNATACPIIVKLLSVSPNAKNWQQQWDAIFQQYDGELISSYAKDSNYGLLNSALREVHLLVKTQHPRFIVLLGDNFAHLLRARFEKYTVTTLHPQFANFANQFEQFMLYKIQQASGTVPTFFVIGNNDSDDSNYYTHVNGSFYRLISAVGCPLIRTTKNQQLFARDFPFAGYYQVILPGSHSNKLIALNTVPFSYHATGDYLQATDQQLKWLEQQLEQAKSTHSKVLLIMHIPPGTEVPSDMTFWKNDNQLFWRQPVAKRFHELMMRYSNSVAGILAGHTHMDAFKIMRLNDQTVFVSVVGGISAQYLNNPTIKMYTYEPSKLMITNYTAYYLLESDQDFSVNQAKWLMEYSFNDVYQWHCENCQLVNGMQNLTENNTLAEAYKKYYFSSSLRVPAGSVYSKYWKNYWCSIYNFTEEENQKCFNSFNR